MRQTQGWVVALVAVLSVTACDRAADTETAAKAEAVSAVSASSVPISTSSWRPGDPSRTALISGSLGFTSEGCPHIGAATGVVWPAGFTSFVKPSGEQVILTADGRELAEGDRIEAGGAAAATKAKTAMPCIEPGTILTLIQSSVETIPGR